METAEQRQRQGEHDLEPCLLGPLSVRRRTSVTATRAPKADHVRVDRCATCRRAREAARARKAMRAIVLLGPQPPCFGASPLAVPDHRPEFSTGSFDWDRVPCSLHRQNLRSGAFWFEKMGEHRRSTTMATASALRADSGHACLVELFSFRVPHAKGRAPSNLSVDYAASWVLSRWIAALPHEAGKPVGCGECPRLTLPLSELRGSWSLG